MVRSTSLLQKATQRIFVPNRKKKNYLLQIKNYQLEKACNIHQKISMQESRISDEQPNFVTKHNGNRRHMERYDFN